MNVDEARAICDGSNRISFCSEPGFDQLVFVDGNPGAWMTAKELEYVWSACAAVMPGADRTALLEAALIVLKDNIARQAQAAEREQQ